MAKLKNRRDRRQASIKARVITTLFNTPGMSDNEICKHIGVDIQRGTQMETDRWYWSYYRRNGLYRN